MLRRILTDSVTIKDTTKEREPLLQAFSIESLLEDVNKLFIYDEINGCLIDRKTMRIAGRLSDSGYLRVAVTARQFFIHNLIWAIHHRELVSVDHKDRVKLNNRIGNLRKANAQQNAANRSQIKNNSGSKGVYFRNNKYEVGIKVDSKRIYLGSFNTIEEASNAYKKAAIEYFGEFANG